MDDRGRGPAIRGEAVEDRFEIVHVPEMDLDEVAVLARYAVALCDFRNGAGNLWDAMEVAAGGTHPDDGGEGIPEGARLDLSVVGDDAGLLEAAEALSHRGG